MQKPRICFLYPFPGIGDFVMATPFFRFVIKRFPDHEFHLWVREDNRFLELADSWGFDRVFRFKKKTGIRDFIQFGKNLNRQKYKRIFTFREGPKYKVLSLLAGCRGYVMGHGLAFLKGHRYGKFTHYARRFFLGRHTSELGDIWLGRRYWLGIPEQSRKKAGLFVSEKQLGRFVIFNPGSWEQSKRWPLENFTFLANEVKKVTGLNSVFTLGPYEEKMKEQLECHGFPVFQGTLSELAALMDLSRFFITNDTGPMHIACCTETQVIAIMNRRARKTVRPLAPGSVIISTRPECEMKCEVCTNQCLSGIKAEQVLSRIVAIDKEVKNG